MTVRIGTSGWSHPHRDGVLYPPGTPARDRLGHYLRRFDTVIREWAGRDREVYVYFDNDGAGDAVRDAGTLRHLLA
ncbi:DUF72 domain-containing protein [Actinoplanes awajinensis]|uniref:DUF72 domain-containing protein n=1 Tax=Actinoplanes awajinensis subsp. mycoplanecinus TaxID=135947 RepID=A0A117MQU4_9ACTN|nr:DUF72 domain-containing protein [Actinoplanes awajinensis]KUL30757.1 hypothetical protein ADL15_24230 [Actinoplanes awajinensis subsp. mycoplanecinus]